MSASRPEIPAVKQRIVDLVYQHWANHNEWPRRIQIKARLSNEHLDVDAINDLYPLAMNNGDPIELSLTGFAYAQGADSWLAPLVPLIRRGTEEFLKDPRGEPKLTSDHLREFTVGWDKQRLQRADELYQKWLMGTVCGGGSGRADFWSRDLGVRCLAYRRVQSIWDFLAVNDRHGWAGRTPEPGDDHRRMARWVLKKWKDDCRAPELLDVILNHLDFDDPVGVWESMPYYFFDDQNVATQLRSPVRPRLKLLLSLCPETDADLEAFVRILCVVRDQYLGTEAQSTPTVQEVSERVGVSPDHVVRLLSLTDAFHTCGIYPATRNDSKDVVICVSDGNGIFRIRGMATVEDLVRLFEEQEKERAAFNGLPVAQSVQPIESSSASASTLECQAALRTALSNLKLHPAIEAAAAPQFRLGDFHAAVFKAYLALTKIVQDLSGCSLDGTKLMNLVFSKDSPILIPTIDNEEVSEAERLGWMQLFSGTHLALRNPRAHKETGDSPELAIECIVFLSFLAKRACEAVKREKEDPGKAKPNEE